MNARDRVTLVARAVATALSSSFLSAGLYYFLTPYLKPLLSGIGPPSGTFPWWAPLISKFFESLLLSVIGLSNGIAVRFQG
jgi:hypothetical protein